MQHRLTLSSCPIDKIKRDKRGLFHEFAKSIDSCQPAQSAQANMGLNFSPTSDFLHVSEPYCRMLRLVVWQNTFYWTISRWWPLRITLSQMTDFELFRIERVCRRQFEIGWHWLKGLQMGGKHCGKRGNSSLRAISPFYHGVFKRLVSQGRQKVSLCGNGITHRGCHLAALCQNTPHTFWSRQSQFLPSECRINYFTIGWINRVFSLAENTRPLKDKETD